jgi:Fe-S cluster biogenesis protein NfuA
MIWFVGGSFVLSFKGTEITSSPSDGISVDAAGVSAEKEGNIMEENIKSALENIRPYLQRDGGDVEFVNYTDSKVVQIKLLGHCAGCPHAQATIKGGIERLLKEEYPEIASVEAV